MNKEVSGSVEDGLGTDNASENTEKGARERRDFELALAEKQEREKLEVGERHADLCRLEGIAEGGRFRLASRPYITGKVAFIGAGSVTVDYDTVFFRYSTQKGNRVKMWRSGYRINIAPGTMVLPAATRDRIWGDVPTSEGYPVYRSIWDLGDDIQKTDYENVARLWGGVAATLGRGREKQVITGGRPNIGAEKYGEENILMETGTDTGTS